jgi:hypothetical protein
MAYTWFIPKHAFKQSMDEAIEARKLNATRVNSIIERTSELSHGLLISRKRGEGGV